MAIELSGESSSLAYSYRTDLTISKPANTADGDFLLAAIWTEDNTQTPPSGWSTLYNVNISTRNRLGIYYKRAASEGASWTWTAAYSMCAGIVKRFTGVVSSGSPEDVAGSTISLSYETGPITCASITTVTDGAALVQISGVNDFSTTFTSHSLTQRDYVAGAISLDADLKASAGASGAQSVGISTYNYAIGFLIALTPEPIGGQTVYPTADITDGDWTPSTGSDLYATLDETSVSDSDYDYVNTNSTMRVALGTLSTPQSGTRTLKYRIRGSAAKKIIGRLIEDTTTLETYTDDPAPETLTTQSETISASISNYGNLRFEIEVANATTTPSPSISFSAIGTGANGSTTVAPSFPAGISAGDLLVLVVSSGATNDETPSTPSGWSSQGSYATTDGSFGVDTGPRRITVFTKEATGSESGTQSVSITNGNTCRGTISLFKKTYASYAWDIAATGGNYSSDGTSVSVTGGSIGFAPGDAVLVANSQRVDTATQSSQSLTASGITFGTRTNRASTAVTTGNDHRHVVDTFAAITAGTATTAPTWSYTASANCSAAILFLRAREVAPTEFARLTWVMLNVPDAAAGGATALPRRALDGPFYGGLRGSVR